jgi:hypothetical protein
MNAIIVFVAELALSIAVSAIIIVRLQRLMRRIGTEVCERGGGATDFWVAYTQLMVFIAPVLLVSWLSHAGQIAIPVEQMKSSLTIVLVGHFFGLALVGRAVWKTIVDSAPNSEIDLGNPIAAALP